MFSLFGLLHSFFACLPSYPDKGSEYLNNPAHDFDGDGMTENQGDCDDGDATIYNNAPEKCDGADNDCDGAIDEDSEDAQLYYIDEDYDGVGNANFTWSGCEAPVGYIPVVYDDNGAILDDCDDENRMVNPTIPEFCDEGIDNDCDGLVDNDDDSLVGDSFWYRDADGDTYGSTEDWLQQCDRPAGYVQGLSSLPANQIDCDDGDASIHPSAAEVCDGIDNDCDNLIDDQDTGEIMDHRWTIDNDADGYGDSTFGAEYIASCSQPTVEGKVYARLATDCNDNDANISPENVEVCDGVDNNCNQIVDEYVSVAWYKDEDNDGYGANPNITAAIQACPDANPVGYVSNRDDCNDHPQTGGNIYPNAPEYCDGVDNDCNGIVDENTAVDAPLWYLDADNDGFGTASVQFQACSVPAGYVENANDCNDNRGNVHPQATEDCSTVYDDNCDGDNNSAEAIGCSDFYKDLDGDGYGDMVDKMCICSPNLQTSYTAVNSADCDDSNIGVNPNMIEICDTNGVDENCNNDNNDIGASGCSNFYQDYDGDGEGNEFALCMCAAYQDYIVNNSADCDDLDGSINTQAEEVCDANNVDENCDGTANDSLAIDASTWYRDADGDGYGNTNNTLVQCDQPTGFLDVGGDCNDSSSAINPAQIEICVLDPVTLLHRDEDCSGSDNDPDPALYSGATMYYLDVDADGYGQSNDSRYLCYTDASYTAAIGGDCDDSDSVVKPGGAEVCATADDEDCDGQIDENGAADCQIFYYDADNDGFGIGGNSICSCLPNGNYRASIGADCNDNDALVNTGMGNCGLMGNIPESDAAYSIPATDISSIFAIEGPYFTGSNFFDYNNDGVPDLAVTNRSYDPTIGANQYTNTGAVYIHLGPFDGDLSPSTAEVTVVSNIASDALQVRWVGNMDNDPADEVLVYGNYSGYRIIQNALEGAGQVDITHPLVNNTVTGIIDPAYYPIGDINNDGLLDFSRSYSLQFGVDSNQDGLLDSVSSGVDLTNRGTAATVYDMNGDGNNETIVSLYNDTNLFRIQEYAPNYTKIAESVITDTTNLSNIRSYQDDSKMIPGDFTGDGKTDLFYGFYFTDSSGYSYYDQYLGALGGAGFGCLYEGSSTSTQVIFPADASNHTWCVRGDVSSKIGRYGITALDLNGDGIQDLALRTNGIFIYYGPLTAPLDANGNVRVATLADADARIMTGTSNLTTLGDINQDGYEDLLFRSSSWKIFLGASN